MPHSNGELPETLNERVARWLTEIRVLDGGFGTECQKRSTLMIDGHKAWSCRLLKDDPDLVCDIHKSFLRAGCDVVSTNTYQAAPCTLAAAMNISTAEATEMMHYAVQLARRAIASVNDEYAATVPTGTSMVNPVRRRLPALVAGSLGPYGACLADGSEYTGTYVERMTIQELVDFHLVRAETLLRAGVDLLAWESVPAVAEVSAICDVMRRLPGAVGWISVFSSDGQNTMRGDPLYQVAAEVQKCAEVFAVGVNCNIEFERIGQALANLDIPLDCRTTVTEDDYHSPSSYGATALQLVETTRGKRKMLILYPNSGELWLPCLEHSKDNQLNHWAWPAGRGPNTWINEVSKWAMRRRGKQEMQPCITHPLAQWVGGCCRVGPEQIRQLAKWMKPDEFVHSDADLSGNAATKVDEHGNVGWG